MATDFGTTIVQASMTISATSTSSMAARRATTQWYRRSDCSGIWNFTGSAAMERLALLLGEGDPVERVFAAAERRVPADARPELDPVPHQHLERLSSEGGSRATQNTATASRRGHLGPRAGQPEAGDQAAGQEAARAFFP